MLKFINLSHQNEKAFKYYNHFIKCENTQLYNYFKDSYSNKHNNDKIVQQKEDNNVIIARLLSILNDLNRDGITKVDDVVVNDILESVKLLNLNRLNRYDLVRINLIKRLVWHQILREYNHLLLESFHLLSKCTRDNDADHSQGVLREDYNGVTEDNNKLVVDQITRLANNDTKNSFDDQILLLLKYYNPRHSRYNHSLLNALSEYIADREPNAKNSNLAVYLILLFHNKKKVSVKLEYLLYYYNLFKKSSKLHYKQLLVSDFNKYLVNVEYDCLFFKTFNHVSFCSSLSDLINYCPTLPYFNDLKADRLHALDANTVKSLFGRLNNLDKIVLLQYFNLASSLPGLHKSFLNSETDNFFTFLCLNKTFFMNILSKLDKLPLSELLAKFELNVLYKDNIRSIINNYRYYTFLHYQGVLHAYPRLEAAGKQRYGLLERLVRCSDVNNLIRISNKLKTTLSFTTNCANFIKLVKFLTAELGKIDVKNSYNIVDVIYCLTNNRNINQHSRSVLNEHFYLFSIDAAAQPDPSALVTRIDRNRLLFILLLVIHGNRLDINLILNIVTNVPISEHNLLIFLCIFTSLFHDSNARYYYVFKYFFGELCRHIKRHNNNKDLQIITRLAQLNERYSYCNKYDVHLPYYSKKYILLTILNQLNSAGSSQPPGPFNSYSHFSFSNGFSVSFNSELSSRFTNSVIRVSSDNDFQLKHQKLVADDPPSEDEAAEKNILELIEHEAERLYEYCYGVLLYYSNNLSENADEILLITTNIISILYSKYPHLVTISSAQRLSPKPPGAPESSSEATSISADVGNTQNAYNLSEIREDELLVKHILNHYLLNNLHIKITPYTIQQILSHYPLHSIFSDDELMDTDERLGPNEDVKLEQNNAEADDDDVQIIDKHGNEIDKQLTADAAHAHERVEHSDKLQLLRVFKGIKYERNSAIEKMIIKSIGPKSNQDFRYFVLYLIYNLSKHCPRYNLYKSLDLALMEIPSLLKFLIVPILNDFIMFNKHVSAQGCTDHNQANQYGTTNFNEKDAPNEPTDHEGAAQTSSRQMECLENLVSRLNNILLYNVNKKENPFVGEPVQLESSTNSRSNFDFANRGGSGEERRHEIDYLSLEILFYLIDHINWLINEGFSASDAASASATSTHAGNGAAAAAGTGVATGIGCASNNQLLIENYKLVMQKLNKVYLAKCSYYCGSFSRSICIIQGLLQPRYDFANAECSLIADTQKQQFAELQELNEQRVPELLGILSYCYYNLNDQISYHFLQAHIANLSSLGAQSVASAREPDSLNVSHNSVGSIGENSCLSSFEARQPELERTWSLNNWELNLSVKPPSLERVHKLEIDTEIKKNIKMLYISIKENNNANYINAIQNISTLNTINNFLELDSRPDDGNLSSCVSLLHGRKRRMNLVNRNNRVDNIVLVYEMYKRYDRVYSLQYLINIFNDMAFELILASNSELSLNAAAGGPSLSSVTALCSYVAANIEQLARRDRDMLESELLLYRVYRLYCSRQYGEYYQLLTRMCSLREEAGSALKLANGLAGNSPNGDACAGGHWSALERSRLELLLCNYYCQLDNSLLHVVINNIWKLLVSCNDNYRLYYMYSSYLYQLITTKLSNSSYIALTGSSSGSSTPRNSKPSRDNVDNFYNVFGEDEKKFIEGVDGIEGIGSLYDYSNLLMHTLEMHFLTLIYYSNHSAGGGAGGFSGTAGSSGNTSSSGSPAENSASFSGPYSFEASFTNSLGTPPGGATKLLKWTGLEWVMIRLAYLLCRFSTEGSVEFERGITLKEDLVLFLFKKMHVIFLKYLDKFPVIFFYIVINQLIGITVHRHLSNMAVIVLNKLLFKYTNVLLWYVSYFKFSKIQQLNQLYAHVIEFKPGHSGSAGGYLTSSATSSLGTGSSAGSKHSDELVNSKKKTIVKYNILFNELYKLSLHNLTASGDNRPCTKHERTRFLMPLKQFFQNSKAGSTQSSPSSSPQSLRQGYDDQILVPKTEILSYDSVYYNSEKEYIVDIKSEITVLKSKQKPKLISFVTIFSPRQPGGGSGRSSPNRFVPSRDSSVAPSAYNSSVHQNQFTSSVNQNRFTSSVNQNQFNSSVHPTSVQNSANHNLFNSSVHQNQFSSSVQPTSGQNAEHFVRATDIYNRNAVPRPSPNVQHEASSRDSCAHALDRSSRGKATYLLKNEMKGDLRKDLRSMDSVKFVNKLIEKSFKYQLTMFSVITISEVVGLIQFLPNLITLKQLNLFATGAGSRESTSERPLMPELLHKYVKFINSKDYVSSYATYNDILASISYRYNNLVYYLYNSKLNSASSNTRPNAPNVGLHHKNLNSNMVSTNNLASTRSNTGLSTGTNASAANSAGGSASGGVMVAARGNYNEIYEVMRLFNLSCSLWSIFGYILGLGDRHSENILINVKHGNLVHVDFDCLFDKGVSLLVPEIVPFRLTPTLIQNLGITGINVNGLYYNNCLSFMKLLMTNKEVIKLVLFNFIMDPLIKWNNIRNKITSKLTNHLNIFISAPAYIREDVVDRIVNEKKRKLQDSIANGTNAKPNASSNEATAHKAGDKYGHEVKVLFVDECVNIELQITQLIKSATDKHLLSRMFVGWAPWV